MQETFSVNLLQAVYTALILLFFQLSFIVLSTRYGWFLKVIKFLLKIRSRYLMRKLKEEGRSHHED